jgi:hypothetical protein
LTERFFSDLRKIVTTPREGVGIAFVAVVHPRGMTGWIQLAGIVVMAVFAGPMDAAAVRAGNGVRDDCST